MKFDMYFLTIIQKGKYFFTLHGWNGLQEPNF